MRFVLIQMNGRTGARDENVARACAFLDDAARQRADLAVLPEFFNVEWENFLTTRALENRVYLAVCNHVGKEGEWVMSGKSMILSPLGKILVQASGTEERLVSADIDREEVIRARRTFLLFRDRRPHAYGPIVRAPEELHS